MRSHEHWQLYSPPDLLAQKLNNMTAVEWFVYELEKYHYPTEAMIIYAKNLERQQQEYFFKCGRQYQLTGEGTFTEVYNETYKKTTP